MHRRWKTAPAVDARWLDEILNEFSLLNVTPSRMNGETRPDGRCPREWKANQINETEPTTPRSPLTGPVLTFAGAWVKLYPLAPLPVYRPPLDRGDRFSLICRRMAIETNRMVGVAANDCWRFSNAVWGTLLRPGGWLMRYWRHIRWRGWWTLTGLWSWKVKDSMFGSLSKWLIRITLE